ncbi:hypothetical protein SAMN04487864_101110 [Succiniclasticum ruminis]|uniref:Uncharacterized protein n=1 Tax=Succiniclasticum ruminis TaxID=40841 RepID=A0A1G6HN24_9FIRM|nr:hypothetical protein [Succiniclasticum ruminis]SDB95652.1 hypothetical protein SAMN04487864_101110 [Succiniclasticum ruminis]
MSDNIIHLNEAALKGHYYCKVVSAGLKQPFESALKIPGANNVRVGN